MKGATEDRGASGNDAADSAWTGAAVDFPRIQGADCFGEVVAVGADVDASRIGKKVLVRAMQVTGTEPNSYSVKTFGADRDGGFCEYTTASATEVIPVVSSLSNLELGVLPCAFSTAHGMLRRVNLAAERILITGASGGVGLAAVQLAKLRGAHVTAVTTVASANAVRSAGADEILHRESDYGSNAYDVVADVVAGPRWPDLLEALHNGGRYVASGAIAGPIVELDVRTLYLKDLTVCGSTFQQPEVMDEVVAFAESGRLKPVISKVFDLADLHAAQAAFADKSNVGKIAIRIYSGDRAG